MKNLKKGRGGYMLIMLFRKYLSKKQKSYHTVDFCQENEIDSIISDNPYSTITIEKLKQYNLDVLVMLGGFGIIKEPLLSLAPKGILSYHHGNMRKYRGQPVAFWELYNGEKEMGVTVQILSKGIDKGIPVEELTIPIMATDNVDSLCNRAMSVSVGMMYHALQRIADVNFIPIGIDCFGSNYTIPNLRQFVCLKFKLLIRKLKK